MEVAFPAKWQIFIKGSYTCAKKVPLACKFASKNVIICHKTRLFGKFSPPCVRTLKIAIVPNKEWCKHFSSSSWCKDASSEGLEINMTKNFKTVLSKCTSPLLFYPPLRCWKKLPLDRNVVVTSSSLFSSPSLLCRIILNEMRTGLALNLQKGGKREMGNS